MLLPEKSCSITYKSGSDAIGKTLFSIRGKNTNPVHVEMVIPKLGDEVDGGIVGCLEGGINKLIVSKKDVIGFSVWGDSTVIGASSSEDGMKNTSLIIKALGEDSGYAAAYCSGYEVDSEGNTPCSSSNKCYKDWFLPAQKQLGCIFKNRNDIDIPENFYWTSTEMEGSQSSGAYGYDFYGHGLIGHAKFDGLTVRCVRQLTLG